MAAKVGNPISTNQSGEMWVINAGSATRCLTDPANGWKHGHKWRPPDNEEEAPHMSKKIQMPALSPTMEEGTLAKWLVKEGDEVKSGDILAEIETDKATMEVEAIDEGVLAKILVPEGAADVPVNDLIAIRS
ncbi:biotin/lipoyl-containing protein, partial [Sphingobium sp. UBA5915]|uniref:biotin/lipoyl-containing protein n=1 Tax=Sphingobium sp. UBA5915 TaxID=1947530 RepID=UPI0025F9BC45